MEYKIILPAEWYPQSAVQLTWPHEETDWAPILDEVIPCFVSIAKEVIKHEKLLIVCPDEQEVRRQLGGFRAKSMRWRKKSWRIWKTGRNFPSSLRSWKARDMVSIGRNMM